MTIKEALVWATMKLKKLDSPQLDAAILLSSAMKKPKEFLYTYPEKKLTSAQIAKFKNFIRRRAKHEPVAYILGEKEFYGFNFFVDRHVLIPRPDTETLISAVLSTVGSFAPYIIDVGTGSGAIAVTLKKLLPASTRSNRGEPKAQVFASDISSAALNLAKKNAHRLLVPQSLGEVGGAKVIFKKGNLLAPFCSVILRSSEGSQDSSPRTAQNDTSIIITANLPYLSRSEWQKTSPEVKKFEPYGALVGGEKGTEVYEKLFKEVATILPAYSPTILFIEIGHNQKPAIAKLAKKILHPQKIEFLKDLAGKWRVAKITLTKS